MKGRNVNPENRDFIVREAEKIIEDYIRVTKSCAGSRRKRNLRREFYWNGLKDVLFGVLIVVGVALMLVVLFCIF